MGYCTRHASTAMTIEDPLWTFITTDAKIWTFMVSAPVNASRLFVTSCSLNQTHSISDTIVHVRLYWRILYIIGNNICIGISTRSVGIIHHAWIGSSANLLVDVSISLRHRERRYKRFEIEFDVESGRGNGTLDIL